MNNSYSKIKMPVNLKILLNIIVVDYTQELTGEYPPETPYTPGSQLPPIRRRVRTAFEFSEFIIGGENDKVITVARYWDQVLVFGLSYS